MKKDKRDAIVDQAYDEILFERKRKSGVLAEWRKNEEVLQKILTDGERTNIDLGEGISFVNTFLSKINKPYNFRFEKGHEADLSAAKIATAVKDKDAKLGRWKFKAQLARTELIQYGRYVFEYHAASQDKEYCSHLSNVSVYNFLIDSSIGGDDMEKAYYMGRGGIVKSKWQIKEGVKKGLYLRTEAEELFSTANETTTQSEEEQAQQSRWLQLITNDTLRPMKDRWKFWEWYTTFEGNRYCVLFTETGKKAIRVVPIEEMFETGMYPFFSAAAYPELGQFWTPAPLAQVRDAIMAKATTVNQMVDNNQAINHPMKAFNVNAIKNPALLKFRADGLIPVRNGFDVSKDIQVLPVAPLGTADRLYDKLDTIVNTQSGVSNGARGVATEDKVGIYEGNQSNAADRFSLVSDSEADAQERFATLYLNGLDEHLTTKVSVEMVGPEGVEYKQVNKKDIGRKVKFNIVVISAGSEETMQANEKKDKITFIANRKGDQAINQRVAAEMEAGIAGFTTDEIKRLLDTKNESSAEIMAEAARDIQLILDGKEIKANQIANAAYKQKMLDYLFDHEEDITIKQRDAFFAYLENPELDQIIMRNMARSINNQLATEGLPTQLGLSAGAMPGGQPTPETPLPSNTMQ